MKSSDNTTLYSSTPVKKAVLLLAVPTVLSQLITVIYNMADTFFIGQLGNSSQIAAATLSMPVYIFLTGIANLFGIGAASLIARSLGIGDITRAKKAAAFSIYAAIAVSLLYGLLIFFLRPVLLPFLGTDENTYGYCHQYIFWTVTIGAVPTVLNAVLAHLTRAEGYSRHAGVGIALGGLINVGLDPLFIFVFKMEIAGAAIATLISNCLSVLYFVVLLYLKRKTTVVTPLPKYFTLGEGVPKEILLVGLTAFIMNFMAILSNTVLNKLISSYSNEAIAGMGVAKKIDVLAFALANGMTQGVLGLIGFNYAAGNRKRMIEAVKVTFLYSFIISTVGAILLFTLAAPVSKSFVPGDPVTAEYGKKFLRIICITCPTISLTFMIITVFQATGKKLQSLVLSLLRKGLLDVPLMFILNHAIGIDGVAWGTPISDVLSLVISIITFILCRKSIFPKETPPLVEETPPLVEETETPLINENNAN